MKSVKRQYMTKDTLKINSRSPKIILFLSALDGIQSNSGETCKSNGFLSHYLHIFQSTRKIYIHNSYKLLLLLLLLLMLLLFTVTEFSLGDSSPYTSNKEE